MSWQKQFISELSFTVGDAKASLLWIFLCRAEETERMSWMVSLSCEIRAKIC
jgi:hypothetical protein